MRIPVHFVYYTSFPAGKALQNARLTGTSQYFAIALHANGQPVPDANISGAKFLREFCRTLRMLRPGIMLTAEDHSGWDKVTASVDEDGLAVNGAPFLGDTRSYAEARCRCVFGITILSASGCFAFLRQFMADGVTCIFGNPGLAEAQGVREIRVERPEEVGPPQSKQPWPMTNRSSLTWSSTAQFSSAG